MIFHFVIHYFCQHLVSWLDRSVPINNSIQPKISNLQHQIMNRELWRMWQEEWWVEKQARCDGLDLKDLSKAHMQKASSQSVALGEGGNFGRWGLVQAGLTTGNVSLKGILTCWSFSVLLFFQDELNLSHTLHTIPWCLLFQRPNGNGAIWPWAEPSTMRSQAKFYFWHFSQW